jgi:hypothetical protein
MAIPITENAFTAANRLAKEPNIVLEIEGVSTLYGAIIIKKYARIGDEDLEIGDPDINENAFFIGGFIKLKDQSNVISFDGTSTSINQTLDIDKGKGGSVSALTVSLLDDGEITLLITPGQVIPDILQAKCKVYLGFDNTAWPEDYIVIFRGVVSDVTSDAGKVLVQINHPDDKKRGTLYKKVDTKLNGAIGISDTTIALDSVANILAPIVGPNGGIDTAFESYVRIDNEIIQFTGISGSSLTGCVRNRFNTAPASHADDADVTTFYRLRGDAMTLALKLMASGGGQYASGIDITSFVSSANNSIFFSDNRLVEKYNLQLGDYATTVGASNGANNVSLKQIIDLVTVDGGTFVVLDGVSFVGEDPTSATIGFTSQYATLPEGLKLSNDEIDIEQHLYLFRLFLSSVSYDIYLKDTIEDMKEFLEEQIYSPAAAFSIPRKARASCGYHIGPIPGQDIKTIDKSNVKEGGKIKLRRSTNRNFYNEIVYKFDESAIEDKFLSGRITISATSKNQIKGANKTLTISSKGLRTVDQGGTIALTQSNRRLDRYKFGAESLSFSTMFDVGFNMEIGDIFVFDGTELLLPDIKNAQKGMEPRLFEVQNKSLNLKTGDVNIDAVDTAFSPTSRYGLISPSSIVSAGLSVTQFIIQPSYSARFAALEYRKWQGLVGASVRIRNADFTLVYDTILRAISGNTFTVDALPVVPSAGFVFELTDYDDVDVIEQTKLVYVHMKDTAFADGKTQYLML